MDQICTSCEGLIDGIRRYGDNKIQTTITILRSSHGTCVICNIMLESYFENTIPLIEKRIGTSNGLEDLPISVEIGCSGREVLRLCWAVITASLYHTESGFVYPNTFVIQVHIADSQRPKTPFWDHYPISENVRISMIQRWLNECKREHKQCRPPLCSPNLAIPKRLVYIGSSSSPSIRLVLTRDLKEENLDYSTLSYCWGNSEALWKTTSINHTSYHESISATILPKTVRDAINISRSLDIPYLWVDALCIIQDDDDDWKSRVFDMSSIYNGSTLTVAASEAQDSNGGFWASRSANTSLSNQEPGRSIFTVRIRDSICYIHVESRGCAPDGITSILHTRGWTFQEMVLSHRVIQFTPSGLHWRCQLRHETESGMGLGSDSIVYGNIPSFSTRAYLANPIESWWIWMENYSSRTLTEPEDKLAAICGIVDWYEQSAGRDEQSALGLWKRTLQCDLLWMRKESLSPSSHALTTIGRIPSWSWLSCPVGIAFDLFGRNHNDEHPRCGSIIDTIGIDEFELLWTDQPLLSPIKFSRLIISGPIKEFHLEIAPSSQSYMPPYFVVDGEIPDRQNRPIPWKCAIQFDREQMRPPGIFCCMLVRRRVQEKQENTTETFMVLESISPTDNKGYKQYKRIGLGVFTGKHRFFEQDRTIIELV